MQDNLPADVQPTRPYISASQISMFAGCPEQYRRRYICGEKIPPGIALLVGTGVHAGAEHNFTQKIQSHADLPENQIVEAAVAGFEAESNLGYMLSPDEESRGGLVVLGEAKDTVAQLAAVHAARQAPDYQPIAVEHSTRIELPGSRDLLAITDLRDDQHRVIDFKTAAKKKPQSEVDTSIQLTIYAAAYMKDMGVAPAEVRLDTLTKTKKPDRQVLSSTRTAADFNALAARMIATIDTIDLLVAKGQDVWPGAEIGSWRCSARFCGYWASCPLINHERGAAEASE